MRLSRFASRTPNLIDVLVGLRPGLVHDLAAYAGADHRALAVTFAGMPWGDRATLAAYGVITLRRDTHGGGRVRSVAPWAVDLVNLAADVAFGDDTIDELRPLQDELREADDRGTHAHDTVQAVQLLDALPTESAVTSAADIIRIITADTLHGSSAASRVFVKLREHVSTAGSFDGAQLELDLIATREQLADAPTLLLAWMEAHDDIHRPDYAVLPHPVTPSVVGEDDARDDETAVAR